MIKVCSKCGFTGEEELFRKIEMFVKSVFLSTVLYIEKSIKNNIGFIKENIKRQKKAKMQKKGM